MKGLRLCGSGRCQLGTLLASVALWFICAGGLSHLEYSVHAGSPGVPPSPSHHFEETSADDLSALSPRRVVPVSVSAARKRRGKAAGQQKLNVFGTSRGAAARSKKRRETVWGRIVEYLPGIVFVAVCVGFKLWYNRHRDPSILREQVRRLRPYFDSVGRRQGSPGAPPIVDVPPEPGVDANGSPSPSPESSGPVLPSYEDALQDLPPPYEQGNWGFRSGQ